MRVSRILAPITVLGPGRRVGLWVQGCDLACPGCASVDTWDVRGGREMPVAVVVNEILLLIRDQSLAGLTVSGGEPFQQVEDVAHVLRLVREAEPGIDVLVFTGYTTVVARRRGSELFNLADVIVAGRYREDLPSEEPLVASSNQELCVLSARGRERYGDASGPRVQVAAADGDLFVVGLPAPGDLNRLATELEQGGVILEAASWRA